MKRELIPLLLPGLAGAGLFSAAPLLLALGRSLRQGAGIGPGSYAAALANPMLRLGTVNFLRFALTAIPAALILSLALALLLWGMGRGRGPLLFALLLPAVLPSGSTAFFWNSVFGLGGIVNRLLYRSGRGIVLWQSGPRSLLVPALLFLWRHCGLFALLFLAALESIPRERYEIARLEGAGRRTLFRRVTLPHLGPVLPAAAVLAFLGSFRISRELLILFGSYPGRDLYLLQHFLSNQLDTLNLPLLCAASVLVILAVSPAVLSLWALGGRFFGDLTRQGAPDCPPPRRGRRKPLTALLTAALFLLPVFFTLANSLLPAAEAAARYSPQAAAGAGGLLRDGLHFVEPTLLPRHPTLEQYAAFLRDPARLRMFWNSALLTFPAVLLQTGVSAAAGYGLWRLRGERRARLLFAGCLLLAAIPPQVMLPPQYLLFRMLGLSGSAWAVVLPAAFSPVGICLVRLQLAGFPAEQVEAARLDGAGEGRILRELVLPGLRGTMALLFVYTFAECWNTVDQAVVFLDGYRLPLSVTLAGLLRGEVGILSAGSVLYLLPPALLFAACLPGLGEEE